MTKVLYDFMQLKDNPADIVDGSDELLPEAERVTEADREHELAGALRRIQERRKREAGKSAAE